MNFKLIILNIIYNKLLKTRKYVDETFNEEQDASASSAAVGTHLFPLGEVACEHGPQLARGVRVIPPEDKEPV